MDLAAKNEKGMTLDEVKDKAWQRSQETLNQWQDRLQEKVKEKSDGINQHIEDLTTLYGEPAPENVTVSLQFYPREGSQKGEPINNFVESGRLEADTADVLYWVSNPSILPSDTPEDVEAIYEDTTNGAVQRVLHEVQHSNFQKDRFGKLVEASEQNPEVQAVLTKLEGVKGEYVEVTNELVTTYLESLGKKRLTESSREGEQTPLVVEVDEGKHGKVLEAVIREDIEGWRDKGKGPGPYTDLRQGWEKELGGLPEGYQTKEGDRDVTVKDADRSYMGVRVYEIARELDTSLAERYVEQGRQMDEEFVVELYKMVDSKLEAEK
jgi:hypothetical protein